MPTCLETEREEVDLALPGDNFTIRELSQETESAGSGFAGSAVDAKF